MTELIQNCRRVAGDCGERLTELCMSPRRTALVVAALSCGAGVSEYIAHRAIHQTASPELHATLNAIIVAFITLCFCLIIVAVLRERRRYLVERMRTVADLNHNVRNALQVILDSPYLPKAEQTAVIMDSVHRIDETLHALFPVIGQRNSDGAIPAALTQQARHAAARTPVEAAVRPHTRRTDPPAAV